MRFKLGMISAFVLSLLLVPALGEDPPQEDWIGIGDLRIVDVHHTEKYITTMNATQEYGEAPGTWPATALPGSQRWHLTIWDGPTRYVDLTLFQVDGEIFGQGVMTTDGVSQTVTATGSLMILHGLKIAC